MVGLVIKSLWLEAIIIKVCKLYLVHFSTFFYINESNRRYYQTKKELKYLFLQQYQIKGSSIVIG